MTAKKKKQIKWPDILDDIPQDKTGGVFVTQPYYQLCPKCLGKGFHAPIWDTSQVTVPCNLCQGQGHIYHAPQIVRDGE